MVFLESISSTKLLNLLAAKTDVETRALASDAFFRLSDDYLAQKSWIDCCLWRAPPHKLHMLGVASALAVELPGYTTTVGEKTYRFENPAQIYSGFVNTAIHDEPAHAYLDFLRSRQLLDFVYAWLLP